MLGHSLSGLYALDLASRRPGLFAGVFTFAPTFSHDTSIAKRLATACHPHTKIYTSWGLESSRDTLVFVTAAKLWKASKDCKHDNLLISRHYASPHQTIMLTGQIHAAVAMYR